MITCWLVVLLAPTDISAREEMELLVNELQVLPVLKLKRVAVGHPEIADVRVLSESELMLVARQVGTTTLIIWDELGQREFTLNVVARDTEKIALRIEDLLVSSHIPHLRVKVEEDKIYVIGEVLNQRELEKVKDILQPFPSVVNLVKIKERQPLVEIDVQVLEVVIDDEKNLGMDWSTQLPIQYSEPAHVEGKFPKLWKVFKWSRDTIEARLNMLIEEDKARTLANPKLVTLSGKEASFLVGGEIPYITVETEGRTNVEWKQYGVNLKILPEVNTKGEIKTRITAEVSDIDTGNTVTYQGYTIPATKNREARTEVYLNEGDIIFIAGLIKHEQSRNIDRLPWLSRVPILGELFKSTRFQDKSTELVISISPRIIGEKAESELVPAKLAEEEKVLRGLARSLDAYGAENMPLIYYSHMVEDLISRQLVYPRRARQERLEGVVKVDLCLLSDGNLKEARIGESSGHHLLDEAALAAVEEVAPYPSFPAQITQKELWLTVPVVFQSYVKKE